MGRARKTMRERLEAIGVRPLTDDLEAVQWLGEHLIAAHRALVRAVGALSSANTYALTPPTGQK